MAEWLAIGVGALAGGLAVGYLQLLRRPLPRVHGTLSLPGLESGAEVIRDRWGVPHIYAPTLHDLLYAQGYVHAQDRFWQMESIRRVGTGTVSEVVGERGLVADRFFRRLGLRRAALAERDQLDEEGRLAVQAYAAGVNAYLVGHDGRLPVEFAILRYTPSPWTPLDTLVCGKLLSWALSCNWDTELFRARLIDRLGADEVSLLEPAYPDGHPIATTPDLDHFGIRGRALEEFRECEDLLRSVGAGAASNAWAVGGSRSVSGKPLLANDPHLEPQVPGFWHESHLVGAGLDVAGVSVPSVPGIAVGHNRRIAWGVTMSLADTQDLYVERPNPASPGQYEYRGRWEAAAVISESIRVRGRARPVVEVVHITRHGPVITSAADGEARVLAVRSSILEPGQPCAILDLDRAEDWPGFRRALSRWHVASLSFVYADVDGNVGYQLSGRIPIRAKGSGLVPAPGWTGEHEWVGYVPWAVMPHALNPPSDYVVSANNKLVSDDYPHHISHEWADGFRARRICDLLVARECHSIASFREIQGDLRSLAAVEFKGHMLQASPYDRTSAAALDLLKTWDCWVRADSSAAALYEVWRHYLLRNVFGEKLGDELDHYLGLSHSFLTRATVYKMRVASHLLHLLRERPPAWFAARGAGPAASGSGEVREETGTSAAPARKPGGAQDAGPRLPIAVDGGNGKAGSRWPRSWDEAIQMSFREAVSYLREALGDDPGAWRWGDLHQLTFRHPIGASALGLVFNRGPFPMGGDADTVCQAAVDASAPFLAEGSTVSYRQIIDLADFDRSIAVLPCGQSGHPGSRHYSDQLALWRNLEYHPMPFSRQAVLTAAANRLVLRSDQEQRVA